MPKTRLFLTADANEAAQTYSAWANSDGWSAVAIGPTPTIELTPTSSDNLLWQSADGGPWYLVVAYPKPAT